MGKSLSVPKCDESVLIEENEAPRSSCCWAASAWPAGSSSSCCCCFRMSVASLSGGVVAFC